MSALPKYFLSLVIFLLAGVGQLSAHNAPSKNDICKSGTVSAINSNTEIIFITRAGHKEQHGHLLNVLIESENEIISLKKRLENSRYPIDVCFGQTAPPDYFCHVAVTLSNRYFSSDRFLLIRVFRI